jgi:ABC-type Mn2+/Zn2+ transport system permease subunit/Mn-dependent DtxR family transcriptional regulator
MKRIGTILFLWLLGSAIALAARISEMPLDEPETLINNIVRFLSLRDQAVRNALCGAVLMGLGCGLVGSFLVVRKLALVGDTLAHAVLPGVVGGFLWANGRDPLSIFVGALIAGLCGMGVLYWLQKRLHIREDSALGIVLSGFFGLGIVMLTMVQRMNIPGKGGLDRFLFGQAAAMLSGELILMSIVIAITWIIIMLFYRPLVALSFDGVFARSVGIPRKFLDGLFMVLLTAVVVVSLKAGGVVLVAALLITPAATAQLVSRRMSVLIALAVIFSVLSTTSGAFFSSLTPGMPTGPCMVLVAGILFGVVLLFAPTTGILGRLFLRRKTRARIADENALKAIFRFLEDREFSAPSFSSRDLRHSLHLSPEQMRILMRKLEREGYALPIDRDHFNITTLGWKKACSIVRKHRMWELYLERAANYSADHVHEDAERVEHILDPQLLQDLEKRLGHPEVDPHGKRIPSIDMPLP